MWVVVKCMPTQFRASGSKSRRTRLQHTLRKLPPHHKVFLYAQELLDPHQTSGSIVELEWSLPFTRSRAQVFEALRQLAEEAEGPTKPDAPAPPSLSGALSVAMCYLQRRRATAGGGARVLCLPAAADHPVQYIATMNAIFAAQRAEVRS